MKKIPSYVRKYGVMCTAKGVYTPYVDHDGKNPKRAQKWIDRNGLELMQSMLKRKIEFTITVRR